MILSKWKSTVFDVGQSHMPCLMKMDWSAVENITFLSKLLNWDVPKEKLFIDTKKRKVIYLSKYNHYTFYNKKI